MSPQERIEKHKEMIAAIRENIEWLRASEFSMTSSTNADLIAREESHIEMYEGFIEQLQKRID